MCDDTYDGLINVNYLLPGLEFFTVEAVEEQSEEEVENHEVSHHQSRKKYGQTGFGHPLKQTNCVESTTAAEIQHFDHKFSNFQKSCCSS